MPYRKAEAAVLLRDMRELRSSLIGVQVVCQETSHKARDTPQAQTLRIAVRPAHSPIQVVSQNERAVRQYGTT